MEFLAIIAFLASLTFLYRDITRRTYYWLIEMARGAKQAKIGDFEVTLRDGTIIPVQETPLLPLWGRILLSKLNSEEIGVLIELSQHREGTAAIDAMKNTYSSLFARGLLERDAESMRESRKVCLSNTGFELAEQLLMKTKDLPQ